MYCGLAGGRTMFTGAREATGVGEPMVNPWFIYARTNIYLQVHVQIYI